MDGDPDFTKVVLGRLTLALNDRRVPWRDL